MLESYFMPSLFTASKAETGLRISGFFLCSSLASSTLVGSTLALSTLALSSLVGCAANFQFPTTLPSVPPTTSAYTTQQKIAAEAMSARTHFTPTDFFSLTSPRLATSCAGDVRNYYNPFELTTGQPSILPSNLLDTTITLHPTFIKNISVDLTNSNNSIDAKNLSLPCSYRGTSGIPVSNCAVFDSTEGQKITVYGYQSDYYSIFDNACLGAGPLVSIDPSITKKLIGGVYFDLDRSQLNATENLLLHLTFFPVGYHTQIPDAGNNSDVLINADMNDLPIIKIHLYRTGETLDTLQQIFQPRALTYADTTGYPLTVDSFLTLSAPYGQIREEQIFIPLAAYPSVDRIRVERFSGSLIFISASLYRMGART